MVNGLFEIAFSVICGFAAGVLVASIPVHPPPSTTQCAYAVGACLDCADYNGAEEMAWCTEWLGRCEGVVPEELDVDDTKGGVL